VDKPASIPVHPCGRYRHNSVLFILAHEHGLAGLYNVHRLDRLTSGLLLFARSPQIAQKYCADIEQGNVQKHYLARVVGEFPRSQVVVDEPIKVVNHRVGINTVSPDGKPSKTIFDLQSYDKDSNTSIVVCKPVTGRTHQIRVHLQHLGHPITNDPIYNNDPAVNKLGINTTTGVPNLSSLTSMIGEDDDGNDDAINVDTNESTSNGNIECPDCVHPKKDPLPKDMCLYLHSYMYEGPGWRFETDLPTWACKSE